MRLPPVALRLCLPVLGLCIAAAVGCAPSDAPEATSEAKAPRDVRLGLLVVDDPKLAAAIEQVLAEYKARSGAMVAVTQTTSEALLAGMSPGESIDAAIYPSSLLGPQAERGWLAPLPADYAQDRELAWSDTFELLQLGDARWGQQALAVPLGSPVFTCYYRADLLAQTHRRPPQTWEEYHELAQFLGNRENLGDKAPAADAVWHGCAEPLAKGWAGRLLLARAAAQVKHRDHYSALFNIDTMEPLVAGAGFVRALEQLVAAAKLGPAEPLALDPDAAREEFLNGHCALAIAWPGHATLTAEHAARKQPPVGFIELPGSMSVFNYASQRWEERPTDESGRVPLLGVSGRLGSIAAQSPAAEPAFRLLAWLSGKDWGGNTGSVSSASPATTLYRLSQIRAPQPWVDAGTDVEAAGQYARSLRDALSRQGYLYALRIPGQEKYLAALDTAVEAAVSGKARPAEALQAAAAEWTKITDEQGRDAQRQAYRKSVGLDP